MLVNNIAGSSIQDMTKSKLVVNVKETSSKREVVLPFCRPLSTRDATEVYHGLSSSHLPIDLWSFAVQHAIEALRAKRFRGLLNLSRPLWQDNSSRL
eukprot:1833712-Amphidinium_carterae.2